MESSKLAPERMETAPTTKEVQIKEIYDHTEATELTDRCEEQKKQHVQVKLFLGDVLSTNMELAQQVAGIITERLQSTIEVGYDNYQAVQFGFT